jgi:hypothetical protein
LELAMENGRFFDLVRWGIAEPMMNDFYHAEQSRRYYYWLRQSSRIRAARREPPIFDSGALFTKNKHEYLPIPEQQIKFSKYLYQPNPGWN